MTVITAIKKPSNTQYKPKENFEDDKATIARLKSRIAMLENTQTSSAVHSDIWEREEEEWEEEERVSDSQRKRKDRCSAIFFVVTFIMIVWIVFVSLNPTLTPPSADRVANLTKSSSGGYGLVIKGRYIDRITPRGVAAKHGLLKAGDEIIKVNGVYVNNGTHESIIRAIREHDDFVVLTVNDYETTI